MPAQSMNNITHADLELFIFKSVRITKCSNIIEKQNKARWTRTHRKTRVTQIGATRDESTFLGSTMRH